MSELIEPLNIFAVEKRIARLGELGRIAVGIALSFQSNQNIIVYYLS